MSPYGLNWQGNPRENGYYEIEQRAFASLSCRRLAL
jgi:hypothetical protein